MRNIYLIILKWYLQKLDDLLYVQTGGDVGGPVSSTADLLVIYQHPLTSDHLPAIFSPLPFLCLHPRVRPSRHV